MTGGVDWLQTALRQTLRVLQWTLYVARITFGKHDLTWYHLYSPVLSSVLFN